MNGFRPGGTIAGEVALPPSKSIAQRTLVCAGLAAGTTRVDCAGLNADIQATLSALATLGVGIEQADERITLQGVGRLRPRGATIDVGESGTGARLLLAAIGLCAPAGVPLRIEAQGTLRTRRSTALLECLREADVGVSSSDGSFPIELTPLGPPPTLTLNAPRSSQEVSALLIALAAFPDHQLLRVTGPIPSRPYVELTLATLERFGVQVGLQRVADELHCDVPGPLRPPLDVIAIEPDASAAAVALAAACLSGGEVRIANLGPTSAQGDVRILEHLRAFGCDARFDSGGLLARGAVQRGATLDLSGEPDLAPVLACVAAAASMRHGAESRLVGLETLPGKESSRIAVLHDLLASAGFSVASDAASLTIGAFRGAAAEELWFDPRSDHRMVFAAGLMGLLIDGVRVREPECVAKSWPDFFPALARSGARTQS